MDKKEIQRGGWYENNFNNFREKAIKENDKLKQTDKSKKRN